MLPNPITNICTVHVGIFLMSTMHIDNSVFGNVSTLIYMYFVCARVSVLI